VIHPVRAPFCYSFCVPAEALVCPSCQAPVTAGPNAEGKYTCGYCGTPFHRPANSPPIVVNINHGGGQGQTGGPRSTGSAGVVLAVSLVAGAFVIVGIGAALALTSSDDQDPANEAARPRLDLDRGPASPAELAGVKVAPSQRAKAAAEQPATAEFEFHTELSGYQSSFYALGKVTNSSAFVIDKPKVIAVLLDAQGNEVGTDFGFAERDALGPDQSSPIKILIKDPPAHASINFEVVVKKASYVPGEVEGLRVEPGAPQAAQFGDNRWEIDGKVFNEGDTPAKFVQIQILALDAEGEYVGIDSTFADADVLAPGSSARWKALSVSTAGEVDHFEFSVNGRPAN